MTDALRAVCAMRRLTWRAKSSRGGGESRPAGIDPKVAEAALSPHREGETVATASTGNTGETASSAGMVPQAKSGSDKRSAGRPAVTQVGVASDPRDPIDYSSMA
jgi:hypothetical protein